MRRKYFSMLFLLFLVLLVIIAPTIQTTKVSAAVSTPTPKPTNTITPTPKLKKKVTPTPKLKKKVTPTPKLKKKLTPTPKPKKVVTPTPKPKKVVTPIPTPTPKITTVGNITYKSILSTGFEDGVSGFSGRGAAIINTSTVTSHTGSSSLQVSQRTSTWHGALIDMTKDMVPGTTYQVSAWVKYTTGPTTMNLMCKIEKNGPNYMSFASAKASKGVWTKLEGTLSLPSDTNVAIFYFEADSASDTFYIDDIELSEVVYNTDSIEKVPSLSDAFEDYFDIGVATTFSDLNSTLTSSIVTHHFSTITMGNETKPDSLLDYETSISDLTKYNDSPAINFANIDTSLSYAQKNGLKFRFHTLVWHSQTPRWFFTVNYSKATNAPLVSKELMLKRMENYIKQIMQYTKKYPDVIYAWDVVNEAIEPNHRNANGYRSTDSLWYQIIGEDFVMKAFEYARKYSYDDAKLFYNDYSTYETSRTTAIYNMAKKLKEKNLIDGIGMQSHIDMTYPSLVNYEVAIRKFAELGLEIQITELDMHNTRNTDAAYKEQATRYSKLFELVLKLNKEKVANITNVTFWGVLDSKTWLTYFKKETSYPLLFDKNGMPKAALYAIIDLVS